jgi:hypothetical protein
MIKTAIKVFSAAAMGALIAGCSNIHITTFDNFGSYPKWLFSPKGQYYKSVGYRWDYEKYALVYIYRPATEWSMDEVEAPSLNVNGERLFNFKGGGYTWYEMEPGTYDFVVRRGIFGFEGVGSLVFRTYSDFDMNLEAGKVYYLRYSEVDPQNMVLMDDGSLGGDGPLQLVGHDLAVREMNKTRLHHHGRELIRAKSRSEDDAPEETVMARQSEPVQPQVEEQQEPQTFFIEEDNNAETDAPEGLRAKPRSTEEEWWPF